MIFFDWDDTLCPTTWIRELLKEHLADSAEWALGDRKWDMDLRNSIPAWFGQPLPDVPDVRDPIEVLQRAVIDVINTAQGLGVVCIVTNAVEGWVQRSAKKWLPHLKRYIFGQGFQPPIEVIYAQREYVRPRADSEAAKLSWVDNLGELMLWKKTAMAAALARVDYLYRVAPPPPVPPEDVDGTLEAPALPEVPWQADGCAKSLTNVCSVGDSEAEMQAAELAALGHRGPTAAWAGAAAARPVKGGGGGGSSGTARRRALSAPTAPELEGRPWVKVLKLVEAPTLDKIVEQLNLLTKALPQLVAARSNLRLCPEELREMAASSASASPADEDPETRLLRLLRTQTV